VTQPSRAKATDISRVGPKSRDCFARAQFVFPDGTARVTIERDPTPEDDAASAAGDETVH